MRLGILQGFAKLMHLRAVKNEPDWTLKSKIDISANLERLVAWVLFATALGIVIFVRVRLLELPLERDEGEYAYTGQLMLQGIPPYKLAYSMKFPGTAATYALLMSVFGQAIGGVHIGLLVINLATIVLIFLVGRRVLNEIAGIIAGAAYGVLSLMPYVLGLAAHATHFVVLPALAGALLLIRARDRQSTTLIFASGIFFGLGLLMKQPGLFFVLFGAVYLGACDWRKRLHLRQIFLRNGIFLGGTFVPFVLTCLFLWHAGVFPKFWFWTTRYAQQYGTQVSVSDGLRIFISHLPGVMGAAWPLWFIAAMGLIACALDKNVRASADFLIGLTFFSILAVCPGFYFRPHYFILLLPAISLLAGAAGMSATGHFRAYSSTVRLLIFLLFGLALAWPIWTEADFFFERSILEAGSMVNGTNPFRESVKIAEYLRAQTTAADTIAVLGSEPQIYFYSQRHSATGYIYMYGLMEPQPYAHEMQQEMIREIEVACPKFLVLAVLNKSWLAGRDSDRSIFKWADAYCDANYDEVGLVNIFEHGTDYYFFAAPPNVKPARDHILIYRRKT